MIVSETFKIYRPMSVSDILSTFRGCMVFGIEVWNRKYFFLFWFQFWILVYILSDFHFSFGYWYLLFRFCFWFWILICFNFYRFQFWFSLPVGILVFFRYRFRFLTVLTGIQNRYWYRNYVVWSPAGPVEII